jgi:hypothetical protein
MALKIVQTVAPITSAGAASTQSTSITLSTGYIRIAPVGAAVAVAIGTNPTATTSDFAILTNCPEILKERVAKQSIVVGDYVSIVGALPVGLCTSHNQIISKTDSTITVNYNSSTGIGAATSVSGAYVARSVKVAAYGLGGTATGVYISEVQVTGQ